MRRTLLGEELQALEEEDPMVREAALSLERAVDRILHPDDYVRPENLQVR